MIQFALSTQTPRADINPPHPPIDHQSCLMDVREPHPFGVPIGMTHTIAKPGYLPTDITFPSHGTHTFPCQICLLPERAV